MTRDLAEADEGRGEDDELDPVQDRLHAARRTLSEAYERRDRLAREAGATERDPDAVVRPKLLMALSTAERALLDAETEMKDAEYALAVLLEGSGRRAGDE